MTPTGEGSGGNSPGSHGTPAGAPEGMWRMETQRMSAGSQVKGVPGKGSQVRGFLRKCLAVRKQMAYLVTGGSSVPGGTALCLKAQTLKLDSTFDSCVALVLSSSVSSSVQKERIIVITLCITVRISVS